MVRSLPPHYRSVGVRVYNPAKASWKLQVVWAVMVLICAVLVFVFFATLATCAAPPRPCAAASGRAPPRRRALQRSSRLAHHPARTKSKHQRAHAVPAALSISADIA